MHYRLTKSKFIMGQQCEKALYLDVYKPQLAYRSQETLYRFRKGRTFEAKIKSMFPGGTDISMQMRGAVHRYPEATALLLNAPGEVTLFEAGFLFDEVLVLADVVTKTANGHVKIFEIKNSASVKEVFRQDLFIQHYVITHSMAQLSKDRDNNLIPKAFSIIYNDGNDNPLYEDLTETAQEAEPLIAKQVAHFKTILQGMEPHVETGEHCFTPYECPFRKYCDRRVTTQMDLTL